VKLLALAVAALTLTSASLASAQSPTPSNEIGPRVGLSISPDQFVIGGQMNFPLQPAGLDISPNVELGVGDHATTIQLNADLDYHFSDAGPNWNPYVGGGLGMAFFSYNNDVGGGSDTQLGVNLLGGLRFRQKNGSHLFTELRLGIGDPFPDAKVIVGWNFPT
jgi:opacity protein-like surface antigen